MNFAEIKKNDIANGPGVRVSLFVSGCRHRCPDCFNEIAWDFSYGDEFTDKVQEDILGYLSHDYIRGLTLLGGEPMEAENQAVLLPFVKKVKEKYPHKTIWCYTGFTYEELTGSVPCRGRTQITEELLSCFDVLVDGKYERDKRNIMLKFRGSENQRLIDLAKTRQSGKISLVSE